MLKRKPRTISIANYTNHNKWAGGMYRKGHLMSINNFRPAIHPIDRTSSCDSRCRYHHSLSLFRLSYHVSRVVSWRSRASSRHKTPSWQWGPSYHRQCGSKRRRHLYLYGSREIRWNGEQRHPVDCQQWVFMDKNAIVLLCLTSF